MNIKEMLIDQGKWKPTILKWDHPELKAFIARYYKTKTDQEIADRLSRLTGKNITSNMISQKRLEWGYRKDGKGYEPKQISHQWAKFNLKHKLRQFECEFEEGIVSTTPP